MREIKFRIWNKYEHNMRTWEDVLSWRYNERWFKDNQDKEYINCLFTDTGIELMQFTGIRDRSGKEIYEGDIVKYHNNSEFTKKEYWYPIYKLYYTPTRLSYDFIGTGLQPDSFEFALNYSKDKLEVLGNIYENKDLLPEG